MMEHRRKHGFAFTSEMVYNRVRLDKRSKWYSISFLMAAVSCGCGQGRMSSTLEFSLSQIVNIEFRFNIYERAVSPAYMYNIDGGRLETETRPSRRWGIPQTSKLRWIGKYFPRISQRHSRIAFFSLFSRSFFHLSRGAHVNAKAKNSRRKMWKIIVGGPIFITHLFLSRCLFKK